LNYRANLLFRQSQYTTKYRRFRLPEHRCNVLHRTLPYSLRIVGVLSTAAAGGASGPFQPQPVGNLPAFAGCALMGHGVPFSDNPDRPQLAATCRKSGSRGGLSMIEQTGILKPPAAAPDRDEA
jgi:hypothetical protein